MSTIEAESELQFSRPPDAFEVSLSMGLDQLSTLESLEEFGFEGLGVNSIGNEELKWMVKNWPRLRVVKGLFDQRFDDAGTRQKKAKLRQELQILKPYVLFHREKTN
ncbi:hypothetical protein FBU30_007851 [Linnemannia zychae]|nr:hypothetical protein FBU30_007851 [Linnemannia zychae]